MYIIDSRRLLSSHSGSSACSVPLLVAIDADHRVKQAVNGQVAAGDRVGDRIDQERHVVVDDAEPHPAAAGLAAGRFEADRDFAVAALAGDFGDEARRFFLFLGAEAVEFAGQGIADQRLLQARRPSTLRRA